MNEIHDIVYVKTEGYSASNNQAIAWEIEKINRQFLNEGKNYVLVGPGRWGSSDTWLGIPVKWPHISAARVIVEAGLTNYRVDPSQGTHFFQNLLRKKSGSGRSGFPGWGLPGSWSVRLPLSRGQR